MLFLIFVVILVLLLRDQHWQSNILWWGIDLQSERYVRVQHSYFWGTWVACTWNYFWRFCTCVCCFLNWTTVGLQNEICWNVIVFPFKAPSLSLLRLKTLCTYCVTAKSESLDYEKKFSSDNCCVCDVHVSDFFLCNLESFFSFLFSFFWVFVMWMVMVIAHLLDKKCAFVRDQNLVLRIMCLF